MGKVKSAIITTLLVIAILVLTVFSTVSFSFSNGVKRYNSILSSINLGAELTGEAYAVLYPEGVISSEDYLSAYAGKEGEDKEEYAAKYEKKGGVYVEKSLSEDISSSVEKDAAILSARFGARGYTSYSVSVVDGYAIKVSVPTNFTNAAYNQRDTSSRSDELSVISQSIYVLTMSGELSLRNTAVGNSYDKYGVGNNSLTARTTDVNSYFKDVSSYGIGQSYAVKFSLTKSGREAIADITSTVSGSSDTNMLFYVGADQLITLSCSESIDSKTFYISVNGEDTAKDYAVVLNSVVSGNMLALDYEYDEIIASTPAYGANGAIALAIAVGVIVLAAMVISFIRYKKLGFVNSMIIAIYALALICAIQIVGVTLTVAGVFVALLGLVMLLASNFYVFEQVRSETKTGKTMQSSVKSGYGKTWKAILDLHVVILIVSLLLALVGVGELFACGVILFIATLASYILYWFTRFMWYVVSGPVKNKFAFCGFKREVMEDD